MIFFCRWWRISSPASLRAMASSISTMTRKMSHLCSSSHFLSPENILFLSYEKRSPQESRDRTSVLAWGTDPCHSIQECARLIWHNFMLSTWWQDLNSGFELGKFIIIINESNESNPEPSLRYPSLFLIRRADDIMVAFFELGRRPLWRCIGSGARSFRTATRPSGTYA